MAKKDQKSSYKKFILFVAGFFVLILGMTLTLAWWEDVVSLFKGGIGICLALGGLLALYTLTK